jgi:hypothetical protein
MIWYRHWIEMRPVLLVISAFWLLTGLGDFSGAGSLTWDSWRSMPWQPFAMELSDLRLAETAGVDGVTIWAGFAVRILPFAFSGVLALTGNGLRSFMAPGGLGPYYTLSLPVSRARLVWTRMATTVGVLSLGGATVAVAAAGILAAQGADVPWMPIAQSLALGIVWTATLTAVATALLTLLPILAAGLAYMALFGVTTVPVSYTVASPARGDTPWDLLAGCVLLTAAAFAITVYQVSRGEH